MKNIISIKNTKNSRITFHYEGLTTNIAHFVIKDINTQQIIYSDSISINPGSDFWIGIGHVYSYIKNISIFYLIN